MPGKGKIIERDYTAKSQRRLRKGAALGSRQADQALKLLGAHARRLPQQSRLLEEHSIRVWEYTIGGYQVIKKWLSYREREILGRGLTTDEVHAVTEIARRDRRDSPDGT